MSHSSATDWFCRAQWGLFFHYLAAPPSTSGGADVTAEQWNQYVDGFDVERLADLAASVGAGYVCLTIGQNSGHYCSPNAAYDRFVGISPSQCSRRDLIADLAAAVKKRKMGFIAYLPSGAPEFDKVAAERLQWKPFGGRMAEFQRRWEAIIREWAERWGDLVDGWWIDGVYEMARMYQQHDAPNIETFAAAMRAGNPKRIVAWNPGVKLPIRVSDPHEDYTAGETNEPEKVDPPGRWLEGKQFHVLSFLGKFWGNGEPRFSDQDAISHTRNITRFGGVVTWDVPIGMDSSVKESFVRQLRVLGEAMREERRARGDSLTFPPAPQHAQVAVSVGHPLTAGNDRPAEMSLRVQNPWPDEITEQLTLSIEPRDAGSVEPSMIGPIAIAPEGESKATVMVHRIKDVPLALCYQRRDDARIFRMAVPVRRQIHLERISSVAGLSDLSAALKNQPIYQAIAEGLPLAELRLALTAGNVLAILADVVDGRMLQTPMMWDGSCIEVFGSPMESPSVHQLFLSPQTQLACARAGRVQKMANGYEVVTESSIALTTTPTDAGYRLAALIPLELLGVRTMESFLLEFSITGATASDQFQRATIFGSANAAREVNSYAVVCRQ